MVVKFWMRVVNWFWVTVSRVTIVVVIGGSVMTVADPGRVTVVMIVSKD